MTSHFIVSVDLRTAAVASATPALRESEGVAVAFAGYVAQNRSAARRAGPADRPRDVLAAAYRRWGDAAAAHVLGQYAAVIVDAREAAVLLLQDSLGVRPLFYTVRGETLTAATTLEALIERFGLPAVDEDYVAELLATGYRSFERTPWTGFERLSLGRCARFAGMRRTFVRPWTPAGGCAGGVFPKDADERFVTLVDDAVAGALPFEGKVLCELSGGLDSTTVLAQAHASRPDVEAFTFFAGTHPASRHDDEPFAAAAAAAFGVRRHTVDTDRYAPYSEFPAAFYAEPGPQMYAAKLRAYGEIVERERFDVVLTGWGGDVVFAGADVMPHHLADGLIALRPLDAIDATLRWQRADPTHHSWTHWFAHYTVRSAWRFLRGVALDTPNVTPALPEWLAPNFVRRYDLRARVHRQWAPRVKYPGLQYLWQHIYAIAGLYATSGRLALHAETRHPLFHRPLVEFMLALGEDLRRPGGDDRVLQRRALKGRLPDVVRTRRTKGGSLRQLDRALGEQDAWYRMLVERPRIVERGWVEAGAWRATVDRARAGMLGNMMRFDTAMNLECWLRDAERLALSPVTDQSSTPSRASISA